MAAAKKKAPRKKATRKKATRRKGVGTGVRKGKSGRPCLLTPTVHKTICDALAQCMPMTLAAPLAGVGYDTAHEWIQRGGNTEEKDPRFALFRRGTEEAKAQAVQVLTKRVMDASNIPNNITGQIDWKAATYLLERIAKKEYSQQTTGKLEVTGEGGGPLNFGILMSTAAEHLAKIDAGEIDPDDVDNEG